MNLRMLAEVPPGLVSPRVTSEVAASTSVVDSGELEVL